MIDSFITYLSGALTNFTTVEHAHDLEPVDKVRDKIPAAYPFLGDERFGDEADDNVVSRMMTEPVHVYLVCTVDELATRRSELFAAALGWSAGNAYTDLAPRAGRLIEIKGNLYWREYIFETRSKISEI